MGLKNVVKVMNFHSLLRVDHSRKIAKKYSDMDAVVTSMIDNIVNNRNIILDVSCLRVKKDAPVLNIYIGSDLGFCSNLNSQVNKSIAEHLEEKKVLIGRKLRTTEGNSVILNYSREEFSNEHQELLVVLENAILKKEYSQINLIYNHYYSASEVEFIERTIYPLPKLSSNDIKYNDDFAFEGEIEDLLKELIVVYLQYQLEIAVQVSFAAENITRQNVTTDSLKKIDERDEESKRRQMREDKDKQFAKVLDNYTKLKNY